MKNAKHIAYFLELFPRLSETFILREIQGLKARGFEVSIFSLINHNEKISQTEALELSKNAFYLPDPFPIVRTLGLTFRFFIFRPLRVIAVFLMLVRTLRFIRGVGAMLQAFYFANIINNMSIEHIHAHWATRPSTLALIASELLQIPFTATYHAVDIFVRPEMLPIKLKKALRTFTCSHYNLQYLCNHVTLPYSRNIVVIPNIIDLESFTPPEKSKSHLSKVLTVCRLVEKKGIEYLIGALAQLRDKGQYFKLAIAGDGPLREELEARVRDLKLENHVEFMGAIKFEEVLTLYMRSDIFVLPCVIAENGDREGMPTSLIEAMAAALPVVSTSIIGIPELVDDGVNGILVPPGDSSAIAEALTSLAADSVWAASLGSKARETVAARFDNKLVLDLLVKYMFESSEAQYE